MSSIDCGRSSPFTLERLGGGLILVRASRSADQRGWFAEIFNQEAFSQFGLPTFGQDNISRTKTKGTVRGLHFQAPPMDQAKLFRVAHGSVLNVVVDLTQDDFGAVHQRHMSGSTCDWIFIPRGRAHGFQTLQDDVEVHTKVSAPHAPAAERTVAYDDATLGIAWSLPVATDLVSSRDARGSPVTEFHGIFP